MNNIIYILIIFTIITGCASEIKKEDSTIKKVIKSIDGEPVVPRKANRLYINTPVNITGRTDLSERLLLRIKEAISLDGRLGVDPDDKGSDLRLEVLISKFMIQKVEYDDIGRPVKKRMRIISNVKLLDIKHKKVIFLENGIQSFKTYSDIIPPIATEAMILRYVLDDLARRITSKTITGWYTDQMTLIERGKLPEEEK